METPAADAAPVAAPPPVPAAAPVPLTAVPEAEAAVAAGEAPRTKRKYTRRAGAAKPGPKPGAKRKYTKRAASAKPGPKPKKAKAEKKAKRVAGTKAQGQVPKAVMKFIKNEAKESDVTVGSLVGTILTGYATRRGLVLDA